jgi:MraZ protein
VFRGRYEHAIDGKGRTSLPSRFREVLTGQGDSRLILTTGLGKFIAVYSLREWSAFEEKLLALPQFDRSVAALRRLYFANAQECEIDDVGRLLIPQTLRNHAELKREAVWSGNANYIELWDKENYEKMCGALLADDAAVDALSKRLGELGL